MCGRKRLGSKEDDKWKGAIRRIVLYTRILIV